MERKWEMGVLLSVVLSSCAGLSDRANTPRMLPPSDVAALPKAYEAVDRSGDTGLCADESFRLGPYAVGNVDRDWSSKQRFSIGSYSKSKATSGFGYELSAGKTKHSGACGSETIEKGFGESSTSLRWGSTVFTCECSGSRLHLEGSGSSLSGGRLELDGTLYDLKPIEETESDDYAPPPVGFRADGAGKLLGAVEASYPGKVWLAEGLSPEQAARVSCLFVGVMLYLAPPW